MIGRKTLDEIRKELEAVVSKELVDDGMVLESLQRFLANGCGKPHLEKEKPEDRHSPTDSVQHPPSTTGVS